MRLYNSLTRQVEELDRLRRAAEPLRMFVCGPTVYDDAHIGHARTYLTFDMLVRWLRAHGRPVSYLENITDVDDRIIARANELGEDPIAFAHRFDGRFREDMTALGVNSVDTYARASEFIPDIVRQVETLRGRGFVYEIPGDGLYFDVAKFPEYGKLSNRTVEQAEDSVSRIDESVGKQNRADFCLWKYPKRPIAADAAAAPYERLTTEDGEPSWFTSLGWGRPGWHIEDTAITERFYGPQYDLHGGGVDIKFPHHEAEIAQQEAASGKAPFVAHWVHTGHLLVNGKKMSKSLGNFLTVRDFLAAHPADVLRWIVLRHHYRAPMSYSGEIVVQAYAELDAVHELLEKLAFIERLKPSVDVSPAMQSGITDLDHSVSEALDNDWMTPQVPRSLFKISSEYNERAWSLEGADASALRRHIESLLGTLGFSSIAPSPDAPEKVRKLATARELSRKDKQFTHADSLRNEIRELGYEVDDTPLGPFVRPVSPFRHADKTTDHQASPARPRS